MGGWRPERRERLEVSERMTRLPLRGLTVEQKMQIIIDEQGYLIVASSEDLKPGDVLNGVAYREQGVAVDDLRHPLGVVGIATNAEYIEQTRRFFGTDPVTEAPYHYKVKAE